MKENSEKYIHFLISFKIATITITTMSTTAITQQLKKCQIVRNFSSLTHENFMQEKSKKEKQKKKY